MPNFATLKPVSDPTNGQPNFATLKPAAPQQSQPVVGSAGQSLPDPNQTPLDRIKLVPSQLADLGKHVLNFFTSGEQGLGNEAAAGIGAPAAQKNANDINQSNADFVANAIKIRQQHQAAGLDTSKIDQVIHNVSNQAPAQVSDVLPSINDSNSSVLGNAALVAGDVLGFGTYGASKTAAMTFGKLAEKGIPLAEKSIPTAITAAKAAPAAIKTAVTAVADKTAALAPKAVLGSGARETLAQMANPEAKAFLPVAKGGAAKTFSSVVDSTAQAINSFVSKSKATLAAVKDAIPAGVKVDPSKIATKVNEGILKGVQSGADYKGIKGPIDQIFKTPESLIQSGILDTEEAQKVKGMVDAVKGWTDTSARGVLNLKEQLNSFYKGGKTGSNIILSNIQNGLKNLVAEAHPAIKPALKTASDNIDLADQFTRHLLGSNETTGETKLMQIAKNLDNPALKGYQHTLLDQLKAATGHDILPQLQGFNDYLKLFGKGLPSKAYTVAKGVVTSPVAEGLGGVAALGLGKQAFNSLGL